MTDPVPILRLPGNDGLMPKLGLGTWPLRGAECRRAIASALALGYRHIRAACEASLSKLRLDHADLYHVHWPSPDMDLHAVLGAMARLKEDGLARAIGVCNFPPGLLKRALAAGAPISCVQVEHHIYLSQERLLAVARPAGVPLVSYSPTAKAAGEEDPVLRGIARKHGCTPTQAALAWLLGMEGVAAIPKAAGEGNQRANLEAASIKLDEEDRKAIAALPKDRRLVDPGFAPDWTA